MAKSSTTKHGSGMTYEQRKRRRYQIIIAVFSIILILSWIAALLVQI